MRGQFRSERGMTLIEVTVAAAILLVATLGLLGMASVAAMYTENHGHLEARTAEYAQDKMEQLLALAYNDTVTDTTEFPAVNIGGTGLAPGGSTNTAAPVDGYVDWIAEDGDLLGGGTAPPDGWFYQRVWAITNDPTAGLKQIEVVATVRAAMGGEVVPRASVLVIKSSLF